MERQRPYRFIVTGGGTGGHIYPAIAVADRLKARYPEAAILFVGAQGRMEMVKVPEAGYDIKGLPISGLQRKLTLKNLLFPFRVARSFWAARRLVKAFKPDAVLGFGGYASAPVMWAATRMGLPSIIQEQNSHAGLANKYLGKKIGKVCVAYEGMEKYFPKEKIVWTGNPVRKDIIDLSGKRTLGLAAFNLSPDKKTILVLGGSLGARGINNVVIDGVAKIAGQAGIQLLWQTGKLYYEEMARRLEKVNPDNVRVVEFLKEMDLAYAVADVVVSRAGALTVSELCLAAKPVIFVPSPNVAEDHQTKNAQALANQQAAVLVKDAVAPQVLVDEALNLAGDPGRRAELEKNIAVLAKPNAADDIVKELMKLV